MEIIRCYDVASTVIEEATKRFSPLWKIDEEKLKNKNILFRY